VNVQCRSVCEDECFAVCSWAAGPAAPKAWSFQHYILPGALCHRTGKRLTTIQVLFHICCLNVRTVEFVTVVSLQSILTCFVPEALKTVATIKIPTGP